MFSFTLVMIRQKSLKSHIAFDSSFLKAILLFFHAGLALAQNPVSKSDITSHEIDSTTALALLPCVAPSLMSYAINNAFYCTGIAITPNTLTYSGTAATLLTISPDLPSGLIFNTITGTISGTPVEDVSGNYAIVINNPCGFTSKVIYIAVSSGTNYYSDVDGDGFGAGIATVSCTGQPAGTSIYNTDCSPNDATKWRKADVFTDQDMDGYHNGFPTISLCYGSAVPPGYAAINIGTDCDDTNVKINPNAVEIPGNGKDDNCDGTIDEITITSTLLATSCGITIPSLGTNLFAQPLTGAQAYRFEVTNGSIVSVFETMLSKFTLLNISPGVTFTTDNTHNSVRVAVKTGGFWRAYGSACTVDTPVVPNSTSVSSPPCGSFVSDIWNSIFCYNIPTATAYRFRVRNGATLIGNYDSPINRFSFANIPVNSLVFATGYTIDVLLQINGIWAPDSEYGSTCLIIMPPTPGVSKVTSPSCGSTTNNLWTSIFANPVLGAQGYKFVVSNGIQSREIITSGTSFSIHDIPGGPIPGTIYTIRVDVLYNNSYVVGRQLCTLTILPTATRLSNLTYDVFEAKAYPNPFADSFKVDVNSYSDDQITVKVYDMMGRIMESNQTTKSLIGGLETGSDLPSGVYIIAVNQGSKVKTFRVIKR